MDSQGSKGDFEADSLVDVVEFAEVPIEEVPASSTTFLGYQQSTSASGFFGKLRGAVGFGGDNPFASIDSNDISRRDKAAPVSMAVSPMLDLIAVVFESGVQIRGSADRFRSVKASWLFPGGSFPVSSWRKPVWHSSGKLFAVNNFSELFIFKSNCVLIHIIPSKSTAFESGIADLAFRPLKDDNLTELFVLGFHKILVRLVFNCDGTGKVSTLSTYFKDASSSSLDLNPFLSTVAFLEFNTLCNHIVIGGGSHPRQNGSTNNPCYAAFVVLEGPGNYFKPLLSIIPQSVPSRSKFSWFGSKNQNNESHFAQRIVFSPNDKLFAVLESSGSMSAIEFSNQKRVVHWSGDTLSRFFKRDPSADKVKVQDICWWNDDSIALVDSRGKVVLLSNAISNKNSAPRFEGTLPVLHSNTSLERIEDGNIVAFECFEKEVSVPENFKFSNEDVSLFKIYLNEAANYVGLDLDPTPIGPKLAKRRFRFFRLTGIRTSSPERMFLSKVENGEFDVALELADRHNLDKDVVFKKQFASYPVASSSIDKYLKRIRDSDWVLRECKERVPATKEGCLALLAHGVSITESIEGHKLPSAVPLSDKEKSLVLYRLLFLHYKLKLEIYTGLVKDAYKADEFLEFRSRDLCNIFVSLIDNSEIERAEDLFKNPNSNLSPQILRLLSVVDEIINPFEYGSLLPSSLENAKSLASSSRSTDLTDDPSLLEAVGASSHSTFDLLSAFARHHYKQVKGTEASDEDIFHRSLEVPLKRFESKDIYARQLEVPEVADVDSTQPLLPCSEEALVIWYLQRAHAIEAKSGLIGNAINFTELGVQKCENHSDLLDLRWNLKAFRFLVYDLRKLDLPFLQFEKLNQNEKFSLLLSTAEPSTIVSLLSTKLLPLFSKEKLEELTKKWLVEQAREGLLDVCFVVFEQSLQSTPTSRILSSDKAVLRCAVDSSYACEAASPQTWIAIDAIVQILPGRPEKEIEGEGYIDAETNALFSEVDELEDRLIVMKLLSTYQIHKPLYYLKDKWTQANLSEVKDVLSRVCQSGVRSRSSWKLSQWNKLLSDLDLIVDKAFPFLGPHFPKFQYFKTLLKANQFQLAKEFVRETGAQLEGVNALILDAAQEHFNSCITLDEESLHLMMEILKLIPKSTPELKAELELIEATKLIHEISPKVLPAQIRLSKNKLEIITAILDNEPLSYRRQDKLFEIAHLLELKAPTQKQDLILLIAQRAYEASDFAIANKLCLDLTNQGAKVNFKLALDLALSEKNPDIEARLDFLSFALIHCTANEISHLLELRNVLELRLKSSSVPSDPSTSKSDSLTDVIAIEEQQRSFQRIVELTAQNRRGPQLHNLNRFPRVSFFDSNKNSRSKTEEEEENPFVEMHRELLHAISERLTLTSQELRAGGIEGGLGYKELISLRDGALKALSQCELRNDTASFLAHLIDISDGDVAFALLKEESASSDLKHSEIVCALAAYFYAWKFLLTVLADDGLRQRLAKLPERSVLSKLAPSVVVGLVSASYFDNASGDLQKLLESIDASHEALVYLKRCRLFYLKLNDFVAVKELSDLSREIDVSKFGSDESYRKSIILQQSHSHQEGALEKSLKQADKYHINRIEMLLEHIHWAFIEGYKHLPTTTSSTSSSMNRVGAVSESMVLLEASIIPHLRELMSHSPTNFQGSNVVPATLFFNKLSQTLDSMDGSHYESLHYLFTLMRKSLPSNSLEISKFDCYLQILPRLKKVSFTHRADFKLLIKSPLSAKAELISQIDPQNISIYAKVVPLLVTLWKDKGSDANVLSESTLHHALLEILAFGSSEAELEAKEFALKGRKQEELLKVVGIMVPYLDKLSSSDLVVFSSNLTVNPPAQLIPLDIRKNIMVEVEKAAGKLLLIGDLQERLNAIRNHLESVESVERVLLAVEGIDVDRFVLEFDKSFGQKRKVREIAIRLILNGIGLQNSLLLLDKVRPLEEPLLSYCSKIYSDLLDRIFTTLESNPSNERTVDATVRKVKLSDAYRNKSLAIPDLDFGLSLAFLDDLVSDLAALSGRSKSTSAIEEVLRNVSSVIKERLMDLIESPTSIPSNVRLFLVSLTTHFAALYSDKKQFSLHIALLESLKTSGILGDVGLEKDLDVSSLESKGRLLGRLLDLIKNDALDHDDLLRKGVNLLLFWSSLEKESMEAISSLHNLWFRLFEALANTKRFELFLGAKSQAKNTLPISILTLEEEDSLSKLPGLTPSIRCAFGLLSGIDAVRLETLSGYLKFISQKKDLAFGQDFDELLLATIVEENLIGKVVSSKLFPVLVDFLLLCIGSSCSLGSNPNSHDLLKVRGILNGHVFAAYARVAAKWNLSKFNSRLRFISTCIRLLEAKQWPSLAQLLLGYHRVPLSFATLDYATTLLHPFAEEVASLCDTIRFEIGEVQAEETTDVRALRVFLADCQKFVEKALELAKSFE